MQIQNAILRQFCPDHFITHNFMGFVYDQINQFDLSRSLDFVSWDNYPQMQWNMKDAADPVKASLGHDTIRGLKRSPFWVIEQQAGPSGWEIVSPAPRPGQLRLWAYQAIAHGADGILFFRWRTAQAGVEQYWHGLLDHDSRPGRRYEEIKRMGGEIQIIGERLVGTKVKPQVAILLSYDSRFAFQIQANNPSFRYETEFWKLYRALQELKISVDIVSPEANLQDYKLVFAPTLHVLDKQVADNLSAYVSKGGVLVVTPRSGVKDEANRIVGCPLPGLLAELCGIEVSEYDSFPEGKTNSVRFTIPDLEGTSSPKVDIWADLLHPTCATVVAIYEHDYYAGSPAITLNHYGTGYALYMGVFGGQDLLQPVVRWLLQKAEIPMSFQGPTGVEILKRRIRWAKHNFHS